MKDESGSSHDQVACSASALDAHRTRLGLTEHTPSTDQPTTGINCLGPVTSFSQMTIRDSLTPIQMSATQPAIRPTLKIGTSKSRADDHRRSCLSCIIWNGVTVKRHHNDEAPKVNENPAKFMGFTVCKATGSWWGARLLTSNARWIETKKHLCLCFI